MKTRTEIKTLITSRFMGNSTLANAYGFKQGADFEKEFSLVSIENILFDSISFVIYILKQLFEQHEKEVTTQIYNQKIGSLRWYQNKALEFLYGFDLIYDTDKFNTKGATDEQIANSKIVKYSAVIEAENEQRVIIKIAGEKNKILAPIPLEVQESFKTYMDEIKFAGTPITIINYEPDKLYLNIHIYRDALVLDKNGVSIRTGNKPVEEALQEFMKELPFDGELQIQSLVDKLQGVEGVKIVNIIEVKSSWINPDTNAYGIPTRIDVKRIPQSGYFSIVNFDTIAYVV